MNIRKKPKGSRKHAKSMILTINEDDAVSLGGKRGTFRRCMSMPQTLMDLKSIMKCRTLDESLHSTYGSESGKSSDRSIQFDQIIIREYGRTIGDNPSCSSGPPVSISWEYNHVASISLQEYEDTRPQRRSHFEMVLPRKVRQDLLRREWDVTQREIAQAVRNNVKTKNQRKATVNNLGKAEKMEQVMESAGRKIKRILLLQRSTGEQVKKLEAKLNEADRIRKQFKLEQSMVGEYNSETYSQGPQESSSTHDETSPTVDDSSPAAVVVPEIVDTSTSASV